MPRKTVTELSRIKDDVSRSREDLHNCSEALETECFDITTMNMDDIRTDVDYHKYILKNIRRLTREVNKAAKVHEAAVIKYREFFVC